MTNRVEKKFLNILEHKIEEISNGHIRLEEKYVKVIIDFIKKEDCDYSIYNIETTENYKFNVESDRFVSKTDKERHDELMSIYNDDDEEDKKNNIKNIKIKKVYKKDEKELYENPDNIFNIQNNSQDTDSFTLNLTNLIFVLLDKSKNNYGLNFKNGIFDFNKDDLNILNEISKTKKVTRLFSIFASKGGLYISEENYILKNQNIKNFLLYNDFDFKFDFTLSASKKLNIDIIAVAMYIIGMLVQELSKETEEITIEEEKYEKIFNNDYVILEAEIKKIDHLFYKMELSKFCDNDSNSFKISDTYKDLSLPRRLYDLKIKNKQNNDIKLSLDKIIDENTRLKRLSIEGKDFKKFNFYNEEDYYNLIKLSDFVENRDDKHLYNSESTFAKLMELSKHLHLHKGLPAKNPSENIIEKLNNIKKDFPNFNKVTNYIILSIKASIITKNMIKIHPILLTGNAGVGKTNYCKGIAECFDMNLTTINMQQVTHDFELCGLTYGYSTGDTGKIYKSIVKSNIINPIILLDEIDKSQSNVSGATPTNAIITALEPSTANDYYENSLELGIDVSKVNWIATANDLFMIPKHLWSRFRIFKINNPSKEDSVNIINSVYKTIRSESLVKSILDEELTEITTLKIKSIANNPREMSFLLREAIDNAISEINEFENVGKISISPNHIVKPKKIYQ
jgi:ATP-dependent Lon protease